MTGIHQAVAGGRVIRTPSIVSITTASSAGADGYSIPMPSGVAAGRTLLICVAINNFSGNVGTPTNPASMAAGLRFETGTFGALEIYFSQKTLSGSETGNITGDIPQSSIAYAGMAVILDDVASDAGNANFPGTPVTASSASTITPPSRSPSWGTSSPSLIMTFISRTSSSNAVTAYPAEYIAAQGDISSGGNVRLSYAFRRLITSSESPGAFTLAGTDTDLIATSTQYRGA